MASAVGATSLTELRRSYQTCREASGGHCKDHVHAEALIVALEKEISWLRSRMDRTGTVYHTPKVPPAGK